VEQEGIKAFPPQEVCDDTGPCKQDCGGDAKEKGFQQKTPEVDHRMVWIGRDLKDHLVPTPLP